MQQEPAAASQRQLLTAFDQSYEAFGAAFAQVPDDALSFLPPGDEYTLGVLPTHLTHPITRYLALLTRLVMSGFAPVDLSVDPSQDRQQAQWHATLVAMRPGPANRLQHLAELRAAHQTARAQLAAYDPATFARTAPVIFSAGSEPTPTSAHAICQWLTDHYREHTAQTHDLLALWRAANPSPPREQS